MTMTSKPKSKQEEALQFLDNLDSISVPNDPLPIPHQSAEGEAEVLAFIDEITQKPPEPVIRPNIEPPTSRAGTPILRKPTERVKLGGGSTPSGLSPSASSSTTSLAKPAEKPKVGHPVGGWDWGSVWSTASAAIQQAKNVVDEQVKAFPTNEHARKWGEGVIEYAKSAQLDRIGQDFKRVGLSTLTDILNVVAPPISEHEVIQVRLSHEMQGYNGVESLVYRALAKVLEQVEGGDLIVNRGDESRPKQASERDFNVVDGYDAAVKLAQADLKELIKNRPQAPSSTHHPQTTYSHVYFRIQPYFTMRKTLVLSQSTTEDDQRFLQFLLCLADPAHQLTHSTVSQIVPARWLDLWDEYEWVEDHIAEVLRVGVEVIGQEYLADRMGWNGNSNTGSNNDEPADNDTPVGKI